VPTLGVFAVIFDEAGRLLCVRLNYASKRWTTPGGRVETGESPLEETGLSITPRELLGVYAKPEEDDVVLSFRATVVGGTAWQANDEIAELGYFGRNELPEPASVAAGARMRDAFEEQGIVFRVVDTKTQ
jgi:8-oxo-dGTP diphosphatase